MNNTNENKIPIATVVYNETMENIDHYYQGDSVRVIRAEQKKYLNNTITKFNKGKKFIKMFIDILLDLGKELTNTEFAIAIKLANFVAYEDGILEIRNGSNRIPADLKTMSEDLEVNYDVFRRTIASLIKKDVIRKTRRVFGKQEYSCYVVNPYIYVSGQGLSKETYELFNDSKWKDYPNNG